MASFDNHLLQAKNNLLFLKEINGKSNFFDWQVTVCFYTAVHLVNAHLAKCANLHYRSHKDTQSAISPDNSLSTCKFKEDVFDLYISLEKLSRRARYLCNEQGVHDYDKSFLTFERHVSRAISRLNTVMIYFNSIHGTTFEKITIECPLVKSELSKSLEFFTI